MKSILTIAAITGVACGARHFYRFLNQKRKDRLLQKKIAVWEAEGGAVPVARERITAQVSPRRKPSPSPRGNS